jgi:hypothetical protein
MEQLVRRSPRHALPSRKFTTRSKSEREFIERKTALAKKEAPRVQQ